MMKYKACLLGTPELYTDGTPCVFPFKKAQILALVLIEERSISKDKICELLWADKPIEKARRNLSNAISHIKKILPADIGSGGIVYLEPKVKIERDTDRLQKIDTMDIAAIREFSAPFMNLPELEDWEGFSDWLLPKREHYHRMFVEGVKKRAERQTCLETEMGYADAISCYECLTESEPYDEKIHGELVRLYIKTNQKLKAVASARAFSKRIENDFGIKADLSDISSLMNRKAKRNDSALQSSMHGENPLARNGEILEMLDFIVRTGAENVSSCGFVWGEQGIGKTVFISEIISCLQERDWQCSLIKCAQEEKESSMAPFTRFLRNIKNIPLQYENTNSFTELSYSYIAELIYKEMSETQEGHHRLLIIENIQWMDNASWMILETIMRDTRTTRHLLVTGFEEVRSSFLLRSAMADEPFEQLEVILKRFDLAQTGRICREMCPSQEWTDSKIHDIYLQTEGNPFFIGEALKFNDAHRRGEAGASQNIYLSMVELLSGSERLFVEAIAIAHEYASMTIIAKMLGVSPLEISKLYDSVRIHGFLREQCNEKGDVLYYFTHVKIREAIMETMSLSRRQALLLKNIELLESANPGALYRERSICAQLFRLCRDARLELKELKWRIRELELHFSAAHEVFPALIDRDLMYYVPSAEDTRYTETALAEALELLDRVSREHGGTEEVSRAERELYILQGAFSWWNGHYEDSRHFLNEAMHEAVIHQDEDSAAKAALQICYLAIQNDDAKLLSRCGKILFRRAKKQHEHHILGVAARFLAIANILDNKHEEVWGMLQMSTKIFEKLEELGERYSVSIIAAEHFRGDLKLADGMIAEALLYYTNCINIGESIGLYRGLGLSLAKAAFCMMLLRDYETAEKYLLRTEKFFVIMHSDSEEGLQGGGIAFSLMGLIYCRNGDWNHGKQYFAMAQKLVRNTKRPTWRAMMYWAKLRLYDISSEIPEDFAKAVLDHKQQYYLLQLHKLRHKVGWIITR